MDKVDDTAAQLAGPEAAPEGSPSFLAVLLDLHADSWIKHSRYPLWKIVPNLLIFMNAHLALDSGNELILIGYNSTGSDILYSSIDPTESSIGAGPELQGSMIRQFRKLDSEVMSAIQRKIEAAGRHDQHPKARSSVAGPLSLSLTYLNRQVAETGTLGHILVVDASPDSIGAQYIGAMNSIFTAQKLRIPIDSAVFSEPNSFLQQAADFTGGSYLEMNPDRAVEAQDSADASRVLQILMSVYLVEPSVRPYVNLATKPDVDFSAVCFVSRKVVEIGMVCSVCLCIMANVPASNRCPVCNTEYEASKQRIENVA